MGFCCCRWWRENAKFDKRCKDKSDGSDDGEKDSLLHQSFDRMRETSSMSPLKLALANEDTNIVDMSTLSKFIDFEGLKNLDSLFHNEEQAATKFI